jgi:solute carrier family 25, member 38
VDVCLFMSNEFNLKERWKKIVSVNGIAGGMSSLICCVLLQPLDLIKTRQQQQQLQQQRYSLEKLAETKRGFLDVAKGVVHDRGLLGLWRGTVPSVCRMVPGSALYFSMLSMIQSSFQLNTSRFSIPENLMAGGIARAITSMTLLPISVVKVRYEVSRVALGCVGGWRG